MKLEKEELFLGSVLVPLFLCLGVLLSTVKAPSELFRVEEAKIKTKIVRKVEVKDTPQEEVPQIEKIASLSQVLSAPSSFAGDLNTLSAGVVSEGNGGGGSINISQGETSTGQLAQDTGGENRPARAIQVVNPVYPQSAQARGIEGYVILEIIISERGQVSQAKVLTANPQGLFEQVAIEAVMKWSFEPGIENGKAVISRIKQKVNFELN
ncbi:MAG: TonB family protein [Bacteriovoracaceae bacterium]|nr:TonB family protein [Bacteriovoracaceae bacterium]